MTETRMKGEVKEAGKGRYVAYLSYQPDGNGEYIRMLTTGKHKSRAGALEALAKMARKEWREGTEPR